MIIADLSQEIPEQAVSGGLFWIKILLILGCWLFCERLWWEDRFC